MRRAKMWLWELTAAVGLIFVLLAGLPGCGPGTERAAPAMTMEEACRPVRPKEDPAVARVRRALRTPIDVAFGKTPLAEALKVIGEKAGVTIIPDPDLFVEHGIDLSLRLTGLAVTGVPGDEVLDLVLSDDMVYVVEGDRVFVTARNAALRKMPCVLYPVADLARSGDPDSVFGWYELVDIIKGNVNNLSDPNVAAWTDEGGPAEIDYLGGVFIVVQTPHGHQRVLDILTMLRKARAQEGPPQPVSMPEPQGVKRIRRRLAERVDVDFENAKLLGVLDFLRGTLKDVNLVANPDLATQGIDLTLRDVTLKCKRAPIGEILSFALSPDLAYRVYPHHVLISTRAKLHTDLPTVMYPVPEVVVNERRLRQEASERAQTSEAASAFEVFFGIAPPEDNLYFGWQELVDIIKRNVNNMADPKVAAWTDEGGPAAIDYYDGVLIVTQTPEGHERIAELLALLRQGLARVERQLQE